MTISLIIFLCCIWISSTVNEGKELTNTELEVMLQNLKDQLANQFGVDQSEVYFDVNNTMIAKEDR